MQGIFHPRLLLLHLGLRRRPHIDHRHAADDLRQSLLKLLAVVIRRGLLDLSLDLFDASLDFLFVAMALHNRGVIFIDGDALRAPQIG